MSIDVEATNNVDAIRALMKEMDNTTDGHVRRLIGLAIGCLRTNNGEQANTFLRQAAELQELATAEEEDPELTDFQWVVDIADKLGRKFEPLDLENSPKLQRAAQWYVRKGYLQNKVGLFPYMDDMVVTMTERGALTLNQLKGVANCLMSAVRSLARTKAMEERNKRREVVNSLTGENTVSVEPVLRRGLYTVVFGDESDYLTLRVTLAKQNPNYPRPKGTQIVSYLYGPGNLSDYRGFATLIGDYVDPWRGTEPEGRPMRALLILLRGGLEKQMEAGQAYALMSNNCYICGRPLTVPYSISMGIGPICLQGGY